MEDRLDDAKSEVESDTLKGRRAGRGPYYVGSVDTRWQAIGWSGGAQSQGQGY